MPVHTPAARERRADPKPATPTCWLGRPAESHPIGVRGSLPRTTSSTPRPAAPKKYRFLSASDSSYIVD
jgi:hypothetical protein